MKEKLDSLHDGYRYKADRISAYLVDTLIVAFLVTMLIGNSITNPYYDSKKTTCAKYVEVYNNEKGNYDLNNGKSKLEFIKKVSPEYRACELKKNYFTYVWSVILIFFYFGLFAYLNDGQTLGKKMFKLRVVNNKDGKLAEFKQIVLRNLFGGAVIISGNNLAMLLSIPLPLIKNGYIFAVSTSAITMFALILDVVFLLIFLFKKNGRTLDDLIGSTKVIRVEKKRVSKEN